MKMSIAITLTAVATLVATALAADAPPAPSPVAAAMDRITRATTPGPQQAMLARMAGEWIRTVKLQLDPSRPAQEIPGTAMVTALMGGRYVQEVVASRMGDQPYDGMALYGFDNVSGKYVATLIDNMGTGFVSCVGTPDSTGRVIRWDASMNDPASGRAVTMRMVTTIADDDHRTVEMFAVSSDGTREKRLMTVDYVRKH